MMKKLLILLMVLLSFSFVNADTEIIDGVVRQGGTEIVNGVPQESDYPLYGDVEVLNGVRTTGDVESINGITQYFTYDFQFDSDSSNPLVALGSQGSTGTFSYTGAASRTYIDSDGVMQTAGNNTAVYETVGGKKALRLEPAGANLCFDSRNLDGDSSYWTFSDGSGAQDETGVDGQANKASTLTDAAAGALGILYQGGSYSTNSGPWALTVYIKKNTSPSAYPAIGLRFIGGTTKAAYYCVNPIDGTSTAYTGNSMADISIIEHGLFGNFWKFTVIATDNGSNATGYIRLIPAWAETEKNDFENDAEGTNVFDCVQLEYNKKFPSSYIDIDVVTLGSDQVVDGGMAGTTLGSDLVTDGGFAVVTDDAGELASGLLTIGNCYKISARTDGDFQAAGSPDDNVGTYFNATTTGVGLLDAGAKVFPVTFDNFVENTGWAPRADAGSLTGHANKVAGTEATIYQLVDDIGGFTIEEGKIYEVTCTAVRSTGTFRHFAGRSADISPESWQAATHVSYIFSTGTSQDITGVQGDSAFVGYITALTCKQITLDDWNEGDYSGASGANTLKLEDNRWRQPEMEIILFVEFFFAEIMAF